MHLFPTMKQACGVERPFWSMCRRLLIIHIEADLANLDVLVPGKHFYLDTQIFIIWMLMRKLGCYLWAGPEKRKDAKITEGHTDTRNKGFLIFSQVQI